MIFSSNLIHVFLETNPHDILKNGCRRPYCTFDSLFSYNKHITCTVPKYCLDQTEDTLE